MSHLLYYIAHSVMMLNQEEGEGSLFFSATILHQAVQGWTPLKCDNALEGVSPYTSKVLFHS